MKGALGNGKPAQPPHPEHLLESHMPITFCKFVKPFWNFAQSTALLCGEFHNDLTTETDVTNDQNFTTWECKKSSGCFSYIYDQFLGYVSLLYCKPPWLHVFCCCFSHITVLQFEDEPEYNKETKLEVWGTFLASTSLFIVCNSIYMLCDVYGVWYDSGNTTVNKSNTS